MSMIAMNTTEEKQIDSQIEQMMDWAKTRQAEAEQLAMDSARLMACTGDRMDRLKNQGFFKRCWNRLTGKTGEMERANVNDLISMQKKAFRYLNMLQEQQLLMAHSLLALKNNLVSLAIKEEETRNLIGLLAQKTQDRFEKLEGRVDQLEISTNLQGWLLGLEEREYDEKYPTEYMRLFRVINDFYNIKKDNWNYNDLMFMRKAIRTVGINPKRKLSLNAFIDTLTDEIQTAEVGFEAYGNAITMFKPEGIENYSKFAIENISSPVFVSMHGLKTQYVDRLDIVETLEDEMNISKSEALKILLRRSIANLNVNLDYEFPLAETAIEILGCLRLAENLSLDAQNPAAIKVESDGHQESINLQQSTGKQQEPKEIHIAKLSCGAWQNAQNLYNMDDTISDIRLYRDGIIAIGASKIYFSNDLMDWNVIFTGDKLDATNIYIPDGNNIFMKSAEDGSLNLLQGDKFSRIDLPQQIKGKDIRYTNIFYNGNIYLIHGSYIDTYFTSKEEAYKTALFLYGENLNALNKLDYSELYPRGTIKGVLHSGNYFISLMQEPSGKQKKSSGSPKDDTYLTKSNDGKEWRLINETSYLTVYGKYSYDTPGSLVARMDDIIPFGNYLIVRQKNFSKDILLDLENNQCKAIEKLYDKLAKQTKACSYQVMYFPLNDILAATFGITAKKLCLSNNTTDWICMDTPYTSMRPAVINNKYIIILGDVKEENKANSHHSRGFYGLTLAQMGNKTAPKQVKKKIVAYRTIEQS